MRTPTPTDRLVLAFLILALMSSACRFSPTPGATPTTEAPTQVTPVVAAAQATSTIPPRVAEVQATETPAPTATRKPTETQPTETLTPASVGAPYQYQGIGFNLPDAVASDVKAHVEPAGWGDATIAGEFGPYPDMYVFEFSGYPRSQNARDPKIVVFPVQEYEDVNALVSTQHGMLTDIIASGSPYPDFEPFLPLRDAWENFTAQDTVFPFTHGSGLRYLTCMSLYNHPQGRVDSDCLFYTYQGLTADGTLYVSAVLPVRLPILDTQEMDAKYRAAVDDPQKLTAYAQEAAQLVRDATPEDFEPSLTDLDSMMQSLVIQPEVKLLAPTLPNIAKNCGAPATHLRPGAGARVAFTDGLPLNVRGKPGKQSAVVVKLKEGTSFYVKQGPNCLDHGLWWQIETDDVSGYVLESDGKVYFVEPSE